jgi:hypothetical protein
MQEEERVRSLALLRLLKRFERWEVKGALRGEELCKIVTLDVRSNIVLVGFQELRSMHAVVQ